MKVLNGLTYGQGSKLWSVSEKEKTTGELDIVSHDSQTGKYVFYDCSAESPTGRRSLCYDRAALESRKEHQPKDNAIDMALPWALSSQRRKSIESCRRLELSIPKRRAG